MRRRPPPKPDAGLPRISSALTARRFRARHAHLPFLILQGRGLHEGLGATFRGLGVMRPSDQAILRELAVETRMNSASIFDLSPSEKLQLVEDLWDDLATAPEAVPVHDWQKQELARRKANLLKNPALGPSWDDVKRNVRTRYAR